MRFGLILAATVALSAPALAADASAPWTLSARNKADIVRQLKDRLADGETARWRWPKHQPQFGLYCGWVNAKNRMGAYTGFTPYMVVGGVGTGPKATGEFKVYEVSFGHGNEASVVAKMCGDKGYDLSAPPPE